VALGVFDGVHRAHRVILGAAVKYAKQIKGTSIAITFWPHPQQKQSLYSLQHRLQLIQETGIQVAVVVSFRRSFARISAEHFIRDFLVRRIGVSAVVIGKNFHFGSGAKGDWRLLKKFSQRYDYTLKAVAVIRYQGSTISSSSLRNLITQGRLSAACQLLLRPVSILGTVVKGEARAAGLGFPTANIDPHHEVIPPDGIYAVRVNLGKKNFRGVCYIGKRPTFRSYRRHSLSRSGKSIEVHIFGWHKNIYGKNLEIQFMRKLRQEKKFKSPAALVSQVRLDICRAKRFFSLPQNYP
jgi:riboflavin kinase/FMN adenylyltransferase